MPGNALVVPARYLLLITLLLCFPSRLDARQERALLYYDLINKAELAICDTDLNAGFAFYQQAFSANKQKPFSKDLMNAFHCAMDTRHYKEAGQYLAQLLHRGMTRAMLDTCIYRYYPDSQLQMIRSFVQRHPNDTLKTNEAAVTIYRLVREAKASLHLPPGDSAYRLQQQYMRQLCQLFITKGIPGEATAGNYINYRGCFIPVVEPLISQYYAVYQPGKTLPLLDSILYEAIFTFDYDPQLFAVNHERRAASYDGQYHDTKQFRYSGVLLHWPFTPTVYAGDHTYQTGIKYPAEVVSRMDRERKAIGLETIGALYRKFTFLYAPANQAFRKYRFAESAIFQILK